MAERDDGEDDELPSALPGTIINGKYRIDGLIGRGGMGSVWSAVHLGLNQRVAVKLISRRYASSREARQRFDVEAKAAAQLRSRFVVQVYDNGETPEGTPYIVMEMLDGESLDARIQKSGTIPVGDTVRVIAQVARALARAHSLGIVHRDLKPENIFLARTDDDDGEVAKVLDFGIAKIKTSAGEGSATRTGAVLGTPLFMSPEQARALKTVDHRTDIYSLGMVTYMMLTGRPAFAGESFADLLVAICTQPLPDICQVAPWLPAGLSPWLARACAREPEDRYGTIDDMLDALYVAVGAEQASARTNERMRSDSAAPERSARTALAAGVASGRLGLQGAPTISAVSVSGAGIPTRSLLPLVAGGIALIVVGAGAAFLLARPHSAGPSDVAASERAAVLPGAAQRGSAELDHQPSAAASALTTAPIAATASAATPTRAPQAPISDIDAGAGARQNGSLSGLPYGKVSAPSDARALAKPATSKPPVPKNKPPDLGF